MCSPVPWSDGLGGSAASSGTSPADIAGTECPHRGHSSRSARVRSRLRTSPGVIPSSVCAAGSGPPSDSLKTEVLGALAVKEPVRLLKAKEWRKRIGEDLYQFFD